MSEWVSTLVVGASSETQWRQGTWQEVEPSVCFLEENGQKYAVSNYSVTKRDIFKAHYKSKSLKSMVLRKLVYITISYVSKYWQ